MLNLAVILEDTARNFPQHPAVSLVAVVGEPDPAMGEEVKAFVVLKPDHEVPTEDLIAWTRDQIAA